jgi:hypothetical protein
MPSSAAYWLLMQVGMIIGYCTSWPANVWLLNRGIKVPMRATAAIGVPHGSDIAHRAPDGQASNPAIKSLAGFS